MSSNSKKAHIDFCLTPDSQYRKSAGFENISLPSKIFPECDLGQIDTSLELLGKEISAPIMIAPMTGGIERGDELNKLWAEAAEKYRIPMGVGSQRLAIEDPSKSNYYKIREYAPTALIFANIGAVQASKESCLRAVEMIEADALFIHVNAMQEACQSGGDRDFRDLKSKIQDIVLELKEKHIPVFIREVGFGVSKKSAQDLLDFKNLAGIDCGGSGGTSWSKVESLCSEDERKKNIAQTFAEWGVPTAQSILNIKEAELENKNRGLNLIATGGIRNGLDLAKAIYLGADIGAMARPFLVAANNSKEDLENLIEDTIQELKIAMFACGAKKLADFKSLHKS